MNVTLASTAALPSRTVPTSRLAGLPPEGDCGVIIVSGTSVLGGGVVAPHPNPDFTNLDECWAVTGPRGQNPFRDLSGPWRAFVVPREVYAAVKATVVGLVAGQSQQVRNLVTRHEGALDAVVRLAREMPRD